MSKESDTSFIKKAHLFQPILVVAISIVGATSMEGGGTGKTILLVILGLAFIVWHVECQILLNRNRAETERTCDRENRNVALYKKACTSLSEEYEHVANSLNGMYRLKDGRGDARETPWNFNNASFFLCSTIAAALAEYKTALIFEVLYVQAEHRQDRTFLRVAAYAQGEHNDDIPSLLAQPPRPVTGAPALLDEELFAERHLSPLILSGPREVARRFFRKRNQPPEEKYMQYIAVPVLSNRNEIIGLIEVVIKKTPLISPTVILEDQELAVVQSWLYHLKNHFLLFHQIEKNLVASAGTLPFPKPASPVPDMAEPRSPH